MIRSINKFLSEFESISSKYDWYLDAKEYGDIVAQEIRGLSKDESDTNVYDPLTAYVRETTGESVVLERFDKAASIIYMASDLASQIVDACDDWPLRSNGYKPRKGEKETRCKILKICALTN